MNILIRRSNRVLLPAVFALGAGLALSQINRAQAVVAVDCPNEYGTIGTGPQCLKITNYATPDNCLLGNDAAGNSYCCDYKTRAYLCWPTLGFSYPIGSKGFFQSSTYAGSCVQGSSGNSNCVGLYG